MRRTKTPLIKNKFFLVTLIAGVVCLLASLSLFIVMLAHLDSCISWNACSEQSSGYYAFCVQDGFKYCCGGWGTDHDSCQEYIGSCRKKNSGFIDCSSVFQAEVALNFTALGLFIILLVIWFIHRRNENKLAPPLMEEQMNMGNYNSV